ncbi:DUF4254 domain-containing protein [Nocardia uniformis]|uniref:DUF4254 domain-containing protein n=1 Tax=Nocardia uniformis TaxID=53432 RepID=A0A849BS11_9NOCA|nr:DUF4254 domain-containing protein [Nocardia uniformis]NNH69432.1 DUF4254 domain-containing protein [Nocardia uniformis]
MCTLDESRGHLMLIDDTTRARSLPTKDELLEAFRGNHGGHQLCRAAAELADLHKRRRIEPEYADEIDHCRQNIMRAIDCWVTAHTPTPHPDARTHTETFGSVIDRMAGIAEQAFHLLMNDNPAGETVHRKWWQLAQLEDAYADLADEVARGWRRLPESECPDYPNDSELPSMSAEDNGPADEISIPTTELQHAIQSAAEIAAAAGTRSFGVEHVLLVLLNDPRRLPLQQLADMGFDPVAVLARLTEFARSANTERPANPEST